MTIKFIELTAVDIDQERSFLANVRQFQGAQGNTGDGELDDVPAGGLPAPYGVTEPTAPEGTYYPITLALESVREYYRRKGAREGTRVVMVNGAAHPVKETYAEVKAVIAAVNTAPATAPRSRREPQGTQGTQGI